MSENKNSFAGLLKVVFCPIDSGNIRFFRGKYAVTILRKVRGAEKSGKGHSQAVFLVRFLEDSPRFKQGQDIELTNAVLFQEPNADSYREKQRLAKLGEKNPNWRGDRVTPQNARDRARRFLGTKRGLDIHHKDGNPYNNSPENLEYATRRVHMKSDGRLEKLIQRMCAGKKYGLEWMIYAKIKYQKGFTMKEIAQSIGCSVGLVSRMLKKMGKAKFKRGFS